MVETATRYIASALADEVKRAREIHGLTRKDLAERAGVSETNLARIEAARGTEGPGLRTLISLALALDKDSIEALLGPAPAIPKSALYIALARAI